MAVESSKETGEDQVEALIDDLIRDILGDSGASSESSTRGAATTAALFETAFGSARGDSRVSMLERLLVAEVFASELAEALAPALAEQLAPRLMKGFEQLTNGAGSQKPTSGSRSTSQRRKRPGARLPKLGIAELRQRGESRDVFGRNPAGPDKHFEGDVAHWSSAVLDGKVLARNPVENALEFHRAVQVPVA